MTQSYYVHVINSGSNGLQSVQFHLRNSNNGDEYFLNNCHLCPSTDFYRVYHGNIVINGQFHIATLCLFDESYGILNINNN